MLRPGSPAPDFPIGERSLHALLSEGEVVVFFFPKAFTGGWTREAGEFRRRYEALRRAGAEVVGVSRDDQEVADAFARSLDLPFPLVGDPSGAVCRAYDATWPVIGKARRVTYVIGRDRRVRRAYANELRMEAHAAEACAAVGGGTG